MHRFLTLLFAILLLSPAPLAAQARETGDPPLSVTNRERTLRFTLLFDGETVAYRVDRLTPEGAANVVIERSPLGIRRASIDFTRNFELIGASAVTEVSGFYRMVTGKQLEVRTRARQRVFTFRKGTGGLMTITVRAMRDGVAFRYGFPGAGVQDSVTGEATGFRLPPGRAWLQPYQRVATWAPAYESDYRNGIPIGTNAPENVGWALPMLFRTSDAWVLVTEAGLDRTSFGVHVEQRAEGGLYRVRLPEDEETYGVAPQAAAITLPWASPWRVLVIGSTLSTIVESTLVTDLAQPQAFGDVSWIKPGRVSWSWWSDMTSPRDYQKIFPFVDLASRLRWEYSLLDAGWQQMRNGGDAADLAEYARARGVGLIAWYNSGGAHNRANDGPRDLMVDPETRRAEMKRIAALGFKGIKVDFMQSDKQYVIALYQDILRDAYANRLFVDFHGSTIPRGWQRTYPNLLTMEAVRGSEQYGDSIFQRNAATFNTIYPFTRNVIGSMDYTPMIFGDARDRLPHLTTNPHELALAVVFESGLQHFVSTPAMIDAQPEYVRDFLTAVPTVWDETRLVDGYPGRLAVLARRRGADWYVGAITSDTMVSAVEVPLRFLGAGTYDVGLISDGEDVDRFAYSTETLIRRDTMTVELAPRGGFVARFTRRGGAEPAEPGPSARPAPGTARPSPGRPAAPRPTTRPRRAP
ncbi:MAG TPA: glycoside hydrolase family 97 catalytic domain-containing protein [Gemmatimonadaceae bacterium]|nr:glycoside hydrolase family 97 catalytic domain-containing protein [Gemmatimonadaceae bacterium]